MGTHHILYRHLIVNRSVSHEEHGKKTRDGHYSQPTYLYQEKNDELPRNREYSRNIYRGKSRNTHRTGRSKESIHKRNPLIGRLGKHQQARTNQNQNQKTGCENQRRIGLLAQQTHQSAGKVQQRQENEQNELISRMLQPSHKKQRQGIPEEDGEQSQIKQQVQHPGNLPVIALHFLKLEHQMKRIDRQI